MSEASRVASMDGAKPDTPEAVGWEPTSRSEFAVGSRPLPDGEAREAEPPARFRCLRFESDGNLGRDGMVRNHGFTLIEMMAVILILGVVSTIVAVNVMDRIEWARVQATKVKMRAVEGSLELFRIDQRGYHRSSSSRSG